MKIRLNFDISETLSSPRPPWALIQARKPYNVHERPINRQHYNRTSCRFRSLFIDATDQRRAARNIEEFEFVLLLLLDEYEDLRGRFRKFCFFFIFLSFFYSISFFYSSLFEKKIRGIFWNTIDDYIKLYLGRVFYCCNYYSSICKVVKIYIEHFLKINSRY